MGGQVTERLSDNPFFASILEIIDAAGKRSAFETDKQFRLKLRHSTYNPLVIESAPEKYPYLDEKRHITVSHVLNTERAKLAIPYVIMTDQGHPIELQTMNRYYKIVSQGLSQITEINQELLSEANVLLEEWATKLREQGWIAIASTTRTGDKNNEEDKSSNIKGMQRRRRYLCSVCVRYNVLEYPFLILDKEHESQLVCDECSHERDHIYYCELDCKFCIKNRPRKRSNKRSNI